MADLNERAGPEVSPSGKKSKCYGEVMIKVWLMGPSDDVTDGAEAVIEAPPGLPFECLVAAAEHLVTAVAMKSGAGFERAVELIAEGAITNKGRLIGKKKGKN